MLRTALLLGLLTGILVGVGYAFGGFLGMSFFLILAFVINFTSYWYSDKIVLSMYKAKEISKTSEPKLHELIEKLSKKADIPKPKVCIINLPVPNAFATGRNPKHAALAVTSGLLDKLNEDEIEGVLSHEIAHIKSKDTLTATLAATIGGAISYIAYIAWWSLFLGSNRHGGSVLFLPLILLAPLAAVLIQLAISRSREYKADYLGAVISRKPLSLASALQKINTITKHYPLRGNAANSHLFIVNPFKTDGFSRLFATHPSIENRVERLKELAHKLD